MGKDLHGTTWERWLDAPAACDHVVQLYTDDAFLARAVVHFAKAGFAVGEAVVVIATPGHIALFGEHLPELSEVLDRRQLVVLDADECLKTFMVDGMPDREAFLVEPVHVTARAEGEEGDLHAAGHAHRGEIDGRRGVLRERVAPRPRVGEPPLPCPEVS